jgi:hypothetical protein
LTIDQTWQEASDAAGVLKVGSVELLGSDVKLASRKLLAGR